jgi:hypothetical protein
MAKREANGGFLAPGNGSRQGQCRYCWRLVTERWYYWTVQGSGTALMLKLPCAVGGDNL